MRHRWISLLALILLAAWITSCAPVTRDALPPITRAQPDISSSQISHAPFLPGASIRFQKISIEQGLSQSVVNAITQDKTGFLWLGTQDGLNRYDGYNFTIYKPDPMDIDSLSDGWVTALFADNDGSVWVGTNQGGVNRFDPRTGKFTHYRHDPNDTTSITGEAVTVIYRDQEANLWVGTSMGLNRFDAASNKFIRFVNDEKNSASISNDAVTAILQDSSGRLWIGTNKGLNLFDTQDQTFTHYFHADNDPNTLSSDAIDKIAEAKGGGLWVSTKKGLNYFDPAKQTFAHYLNDPENPDSLMYDNINDILVDSAGILWVGSERGLDRYDAERNKFIHYRSNPLVPNSLVGDVVHSIFEDREGILWFGMWGGGVNKYDRAENQFALYRNDPGNTESLSDGVFPIFTDSDGVAWIGTYGHGLNRFDPLTGVFRHYEYDIQNPDGIGSPSVWDIRRDRQGVLWLATSAGLDEFDESNNKFIHHKFNTSAPGRDGYTVVRTVHEDRAGNLWVGNSKGFFLYDRVGGIFTRYGDPETLVAVSKIFDGRDGNLWITTSGRGLYHFDIKTKTFERFVHDEENPNSLVNDTVLWAYEDERNILWLATAGGLNKLDTAARSFSLYTERQGLPNNFIYCVVPGNNGFLWLTTNYGLSRFDPLKATFQNYTVDDGLQSNEFNSNACARSADGSIYVGGIVGMNRFFPDEIFPNAYPPPVALTSLTAAGNSLVTGRTVDTLDEIVLKWPQNSLEFEFAALSFSQPENNQYAYMLENFDTEWNMLGVKRDGRYTNLPGGEYILRLKAASHDGGAWNESASPLRVTVIPPFWQTWQFVGLSILFGVAAVFGIYRLRVYGVEAQKIELERQVNERTREIEKLFEQTKELAIIEERNRLARELHDSAKQKAFAALAQLGTAGGLIQRDATAAQIHINEAENLVHDVIQELTFLIQEMYPLALQEKGLVATLREYVYEWENRADIRAHLSVENECRLPVNVEQALYRIAQEALANIARHSRASQVTLNLTYSAGEVMLTILDNGSGFDMAQKPKGIGLRSIRERAESIGGHIVIESAPGKGTRIEVSIPQKA
jgi:signal transduction histidine kinase/ligand-binding sensor domain-containing protein